MRPFIFVMAMLLSTFLLFLTFYPLTKTQNGDSIPKTDFSDFSTNMNESLHRFEYFPTVANLPVKEVFNLLIIIEAINSSFRDSQRFLCGGFNALAQPLFCMLLSIYSFLSSYRMSVKHKSVIAMYIGGHAPPTIMA